MPVGRTKNAVARLREPHRTLLRQQNQQQCYKQRSDQRFSRKMLEYPDQRHMHVRCRFVVTVEQTKRAFEVCSCRIMGMRCKVRRAIGVYAYTQTLGE